jgi:hypothetical protein
VARFAASAHWLTPAGERMRMTGTSAHRVASCDHGAASGIPLGQAAPSVVRVLLVRQRARSPAVTGKLHSRADRPAPPAASRRLEVAREALDPGQQGLLALSSQRETRDDPAGRDT